LKEEIEFELGELRRQTACYSELLEQVRERKPNETEIMACAALLHAFYMGIENIFKRICRRLDESLPHGDSWHVELLMGMTKPTNARPAVISESLFVHLRGYLGFRHLFRNLYTFHLNWNRMEPLVKMIEEVREKVEKELIQFIREMEKTSD
jgi:hypothetical protein